MNVQKKQPKQQPNTMWRGALVWISLILLLMVIIGVLNSRKTEEITIPFSRFLSEVDNGNVSRVEIMNLDIKGNLKTKITAATKQGSVSFNRFKTHLPFPDANLAKDLAKKGVVVDSHAESGWWKYFWPTLPFLVLIVIWIFFFRQVQSGPTKALSFGKSRAKLTLPNKQNVTFNDVAGVEEAKEELREIIEFLKNPKRFERLGAKIPKGVLLLGPPGTGKTLLAKAVAGEAGVPFFSLSGSDFVEMFVGVGASRVRDLFEKSKKFAPSIIFIDEIDAVGRYRGAGIGGGHDEREQTLNALLSEMDGFETNEGVILIAATNRPDVLDPALLRPGRFDRRVVVDFPDLRGREGILKVHTRKIPLNKDVDLSVLARGTPGFSGADLANMVNEAALLAAKHNQKKVAMEDFEKAKDKILMGVERKSMLISEEEKKLTAYHESGHVLVSEMTPGTDPIHKVTIIPRGRALGTTQQLPIDDRHNYSENYLKAKLVTLLGGRAAELLIFSNRSTGAQNDIKTATEIARNMVTKWGMSEKLGPLTLSDREEQIFLGREIAQRRDYSEATARLIDSEVKALVDEAEKKAIKILKDNIHILERLAKALLEKEVLTKNEIEKIIKGAKRPTKRTKKMTKTQNKKS
ncbi:MAG: cell division protein FtsH [Candidatus Cloacimonas sp. 4484_209]|nr:MAG: cell division protein FtsH [Candidatus Cloacimonas sp. 4484_209]